MNLLPWLLRALSVKLATASQSSKTQNNYNVFPQLPNNNAIQSFSLYNVRPHLPHLVSPALLTHFDSSLTFVLLFRRGNAWAEGWMWRGAWGSTRREDTGFRWEGFRSSPVEIAGTVPGCYLQFVGCHPWDEYTEVCGPDVGCCLGICLRPNGRTWPRKLVPFPAAALPQFARQISWG